VRIPLHVQSECNTTIIIIPEDEQLILQELGNTRFSWAPRYRGFSLTFDNTVGFPFMALSWIKGSPLRWTPMYLPRPIRNKLLYQVAEIQIALVECTKETVC
jgi:hypothetical protein